MRRYTQYALLLVVATTLRVIYEYEGQLRASSLAASLQPPRLLGCDVDDATFYAEAANQHGMPARSHWRTPCRHCRQRVCLLRVLARAATWSAQGVPAHPRCAMQGCCSVLDAAMALCAEENDANFFF